MFRNIGRRRPIQARITLRSPTMDGNSPKTAPEMQDTSGTFGVVLVSLKTNRDNSPLDWEKGTNTKESIGLILVVLCNTTK